MAEAGLEFEETPERQAIAQGLGRAQAELESVGARLRSLGSRERAHKVLNIAQQAAAQKCLLAQDWAIDDAKLAT